jgi:hypothetical protein
LWVTQHDKFWVKLCVIVMWKSMKCFATQCFQHFQKECQIKWWIIFYHNLKLSKIYICLNKDENIFFSPKTSFGWPSLTINYLFIPIFLDIVFLKWFICMSFIHHQNCMVNGAQHLNASLHKLAILKFAWN